MIPRPVSAAAIAAFAAIAAIARAGAQQGSPAAEPVQVQMGYSVVPDTVTVGDPFRVTVRIRAPLGSSVTFPAGPDSGATVEALDSRKEQQGADSLALDVSATWRLAAWDTGDQPLRMRDVVVSVDGRERRIPLGALNVHVRSVLPADSALHVPKPQRALFEFGRPWWHWLLLALAAIGIIGLLWWWWRRRRKRAGDSAEDPFDEAQAEFDRVERLGLVEAGERGRYVALMVEVLRTYLARRITAAHPSLTTSELLIAVREQSAVPVNRLALVLADADLVKFARRATTAERARELGAEAKGIVAAVRDAELRAAEAAKQAAQAPRERAA